MKSIKRVVDTSFWSDEKVMNFSPEDKYFWLFLLTNEYTTQLGIYHLPIKKAAFDLGYSVDTVEILLDRFESKYDMIRYSKISSEVAIKNYLLYSIVKGGKPVYDCLVKEQEQVKDKSLLGYVCDHLTNKEINNNTVLDYINQLSISNELNNINDNDNERIVDESLTNRGRIVKEKPKRSIIPPDIEWVKAYCRERNNNVDPEKFFDFYTSKNWMIGKTKMKDWEASIRTWERDDRRQTKKPEKSYDTDYDFEAMEKEYGLR